MTKAALTPQQHAELEKLRAEHLRANNYAAEMLSKYGSDSPQFGEADKIAAEISARIKTLSRDG
jgi:hypothetical protein